MKRKKLATLAILAVMPMTATAGDFQLQPNPPSNDEQLLDFTNENRRDIGVLREDVERNRAGIGLSNAMSAHQFDIGMDRVQWSVAAGSFEAEAGASVALLVPVGENTALTFMGGTTQEGDKGAAISLSGAF